MPRGRTRSTVVVHRSARTAPPLVRGQQADRVTHDLDAVVGPDGWIDWHALVKQVDRKTVARWVRAGRLERLHPGVYAVPAAARNWRARLEAAVHATGGVVSHRIRPGPLGTRPGGRPAPRHRRPHPQRTRRRRRGAAPDPGAARHHPARRRAARSVRGASGRRLLGETGRPVPSRRPSRDDRMADTAVRAPSSDHGARELPAGDPRRLHRPTRVVRPRRSALRPPSTRWKGGCARTPSRPGGRRRRAVRRPASSRARRRPRRPPRRRGAPWRRAGSDVGVTPGVSEPRPDAAPAAIAAAAGASARTRRASCASPNVKRGPSGVPQGGRRA